MIFSRDRPSARRTFSNSAQQSTPSLKICQMFYTEQICQAKFLFVIIIIYQLKISDEVKIQLTKGYLTDSTYFVAANRFRFYLNPKMFKLVWGISRQICLMIVIFAFVKPSLFERTNLDDSSCPETQFRQLPSVPFAFAAGFNGGGECGKICESFQMRLPISDK